MDEDSSSRDIYYIKNAEFFNNVPPKFRHDDRNLIPYSEKLGFKTSNNRAFVCDKCNCDTVYISDMVSGKLCPKCVHDCGYHAICDMCNRQNGCSSCGGVSSSMVELIIGGEERIVCNQDKCLMPFGYHSFLNIPCTCAVDSLLEYYKIFPKDVYNLMVKYMGDSINALDRYSTRTVLLCDNTVTPNKCLRHTIQNKFNAVDSSQVVNVRKCMCKCFL